MAELPPSAVSARWLRWGAWLVAVAITIPGPASAIDGGVDGSWRWAINVLPTPDARFGDVVYPYGPLGFILVPTYAGGKAAWAIVAQWLLHALFGVALWRVLRDRGALRAWGLAGTLVLAHWAGMVYESQLVIGLILLLAPLATGECEARWPAVAGGLFAGLALLAKLSLGVAALAVLCALGMPRIAARRRSAALALIAATGVGLLAGALAFRSPGRARSWWTGSREMAVGFAEAMTLGDSGGRLALALAGLALFAALAVWLSVRRDATRDLAWLCAPALGLACAHSITRLDAEHARLFAPLLLAAFGLLAAVALRATAVACGVAALLVGLALLPQVGAGAPRGRMAWLSNDFARRVRAVLAPRQAALAAGRRSRAALEPLRFDAPWITEWRAERRSVDALPLRLGYIAANELRWRPSPTLQLFAALTGALDRRGEIHFCAPSSPDRLLVRFEDIDGRNMVWDAPRTWRAIAACYEPDPEAGDAGAGDRRVRALRRRAAPAAWRWRALGDVAMAAGEWIEVPQAAEELVVGDLEIERSVLGRLAGPLWPAAPLWLEAELPSGGRERWRLVRRTAPGGLQLAPLPGELRHLNAWWNANPFDGRRARRVRWLAERDGWSYEDRATIRFRGGRLTPPATPRPAAGAAP
jgi:hypothetical protein